VDGTAQPDSARSWPLADGPFLTSTAHDGLIKIRRPGCANALVLDFRNESFPARTEPATPDPAVCPAP
jgi:hypothetical protein